MKFLFALAIVAFIGCSVEGALVRRDLKSDLVNKGNDLVKKAEEAITKLEGAHKHHEVTVVKSEVAHIQKLIAELEKASDEHKVKHLEMELSRVEHKLQFELAKIDHHDNGNHDHHHHHESTTAATLVKRDLKSDLLLKAKSLAQKAEDAIKKLPEHSQEAKRLRNEEHQVKRLAAELETAHEEHRIKALEHELNRAEERLNQELEHPHHHQQ
ncbi:hypothetical protein BLOT_001771 [Blomia tropicalis]|nr:hypothetical protein BLOT_001771 [Blomia tropicalis]